MTATATRCPAWCTTTAAEHAADDPGRLMHDGPEIGDGILAVQAGDGPVLGYFAHREGEMTAEQLRALALACDQAAAWIEAPPVTTQTAPWWQTAANPPCASWCDIEHDEDEFTKGGSLVCAADLEHDERYPFWVTRIASTDVEDTPGVVELGPPILGGLNLDELPRGGCPVHEVRRYADALMRAVAKLEEHTR